MASSAEVSLIWARPFSLTTSIGGFVGEEISSITRLARGIEISPDLDELNHPRGFGRSAWYHLKLMFFSLRRRETSPLSQLEMFFGWQDLRAVLASNSSAFGFPPAGWRRTGQTEILHIPFQLGVGQLRQEAFSSSTWAGSTMMVKRSGSGKYR